MAKITTYKKLGVPLGWWIHLSHKEACIVGGGTVSAIQDLITKLIPNVWVAIVSKVIKAQREFIKKKNETSGGKGVKLLFIWATGMIMSIERKGKGKSPCT